MEARYHVLLAGPVPAAVVDVMTSRFGCPEIRTQRNGTVLEGGVADQAALRALLNLLWDVGGDIRLVRVAPPSASR